MKNALFLVGAVASLLIASEASAAKKTYAADLRSDQENIAPDLGTHDPQGTGRFTFDDVTKELCGVITYTDLTGNATGVHVHQAPAGDPTGDGPVKIEIPPTASPVAFNVKLNASFEKSLTDGELYANIHTATNAKGEIRTTSPWIEDTNGAPVTCPPPTVVLGDAGATPVDAGGSTTSSTSSSTSGSTGTSGGTSSGGESSTSSGGSTDEPASSSSGKSSAADAGTKAAKPAGGCNTSGNGSGPLSLAFLVGAAIVVSQRLRRRR